MSERKYEDENGWQRWLWNLGWRITPLASEHWYRNIGWRLRARLAIRILRRFPKDYMVYVPGPYDDSESTVYAFSCNDPTSSWHYTADVQRQGPTRGES